MISHDPSTPVWERDIIVAEFVDNFLSQRLDRSGAQFVACSLSGWCDMLDRSIR